MKVRIGLRPVLTLLGSKPNLPRQKRDKKKDTDEIKVVHRRGGSDGASSTKNEKLKSIQENHPPVRRNTPFPRASSLQPNMGNVLSDLKRAATAKFSTAYSNNSAPPSGQSVRSYPSNEQMDISSHNNTASDQMPRHRQPAVSTPKHNNCTSQDSSFKTRRVAEDEPEKKCARDQAEALEVARVAKEAKERERAEEEAAAEETARITILERQHTEEEATRMAMLERQYAEEAAATEETARIAILERQHTEEEAARMAMLERHREEEAAAVEEAARIAIQDKPMRKWSIDTDGR